MKIGIYSGSFNPVHNGHIALAAYIREHSDLDEIWMLVTPHNPLKQQSSLAGDEKRFTMLKLALQGFEHIKASDIEFHLPKPSYTIQTLRHLSEKFPDDEFVLIIGEDNLAVFDKWKDYKEILDHYKVLVYPRSGYHTTIPDAYKKSVCYINAPLYNISSTQVRNTMKNGEDVSRLLPLKVYEYIQKEKLYVN